jgi:hypothetical protein
MHEKVSNRDTRSGFFCRFGSLKGPTITKFADPNFNFLRPAVRDTGSERGNPKLNVEAVN